MASPRHNITHHQAINGSTASFSSLSSSQASPMPPPTHQASVYLNTNTEQGTPSHPPSQPSSTASPAPYPHPMGSSYSSSTSSTPSANRLASKGVILGQAAASTGAKLKRALAGRRRPSEDISQLLNGHAGSSNRHVTSSSYHGTPTGAKHPTPLGGKGRLALQIGSSVFGKKAAKPSAVIASPPVPPPKSSSDFSTTMPPLSLHQSLPENRNSIIAVSPAMTSALAYMRQEDSHELASNSSPVTPTPRPLPAQDRAELKENWRKSDATMTTVRQNAGAASRGSRPVSMAESSHSAHTIVPTSKRLSALIIDSDYRMPEEEEPTSSEALTIPTPAGVHGQDTPNNFTPPHIRQPAPVPVAKGPTHYPGPLLSEHRPSPSDTPSLTRTTTNGIIGSSSLDSQPISHNIRGTLNSLSPSPSSEDHPSGYLRSQSGMRSVSPASSHSNALRQTAISITNTLTPAAGLAKRAVERMGRAWGMHSSSNLSSSSLSSTPPSSYSSVDYSLSRTSSNQSDPVNSKKPRRRTPDAPSSSWSIQSSSTSSDSDAFVPAPGPDLGHMLRGPLNDARGGRGHVFGCPLKEGVDTTHVVLEQRSTVHDEQCADLLPLQDRQLSALALRCSQHILAWGVHEEGLFRVSGRPSHVSRLRAEFDSGADYNLASCSPGDLDPHAVSSVFKAYLRELPEPILTHRLQASFEAAIATEMDESNSATPGAGNQPKRSERGFGLPSSPRGGPALRKPPSLSTLAMPSFAGVRPASATLRGVLRHLITCLPVENRDILHTVVDLIRATSRESKETKMPLSNLLLVLYPSLNMSPPLLRVLCESSDIWEAGPIPPVLDIKRESQGVIDIARTPVAEISLSSSSPRKQSSDKPLPPDFPLLVPSDSSSVSPGSSVPSSPVTPFASDDVKVDLDTQLLPDSLYTTPSSSSNSLRTSPQPQPTIHRKSSLGNLLKSKTRPPLRAVATQGGKRPIISPPISAPVLAPVQFPITSSVPTTPVTSRRSMPLLSLPSLSSLRYKQVSPTSRGLWTGGSGSSRRLSLIKKHSSPDLLGSSTGTSLHPTQEDSTSYVLPSLSVDITRSLEFDTGVPAETSKSTVDDASPANVHAGRPSPTFSITPSSSTSSTTPTSPATSTTPTTPTTGTTTPTSLTTARWPRGRTQGKLDLLPEPDSTMEDDWTESVLMDLDVFGRS